MSSRCPTAWRRVLGGRFSGSRGPIPIAHKSPLGVLLLGIETATDVCGVALFAEEVLLGEASVDKPRSHAAQLVPLIQQLLQGANRSAAELDVIAVSGGPGSYTGLRIGASTAKGLAFAADAALVAVPSLDALASCAPMNPRRPILVIFPSRRGEVYAAVFDVQANGLTRSMGPMAVSVGELDDLLPSGEMYVLGPGSDLVREAIIPKPERLLFVDSAASPAAVAKLGLERFRSGETENVASWEPYYLKAFIAKAPRPIFG